MKLTTKDNGETFKVFKDWYLSMDNEALRKPMTQKEFDEFMKIDDNDLPIDEVTAQYCNGTIE